MVQNSADLKNRAHRVSIAWGGKKPTGKGKGLGGHTDLQDTGISLSFKETYRRSLQGTAGGGGKNVVKDGSRSSKSRMAVWKRSAVREKEKSSRGGRKIYTDTKVSSL